MVKSPLSSPVSDQTRLGLGGPAVYVATRKAFSSGWLTSDGPLRPRAASTVTLSDSTLAPPAFNARTRYA